MSHIKSPSAEVTLLIMDYFELIFINTATHPINRPPDQTDDQKELLCDVAWSARIKFSLCSQTVMQGRRSDDLKETASPIRHVNVTKLFQSVSI